MQFWKTCARCNTTRHFKTNMQLNWCKQCRAVRYQWVACDEPQLGGAQTGTTMQVWKTCARCNTTRHFKTNVKCNWCKQCRSSRYQWAACDATPPLPACNEPQLGGAKPGPTMQFWKTCTRCNTTRHFKTNMQINRCKQCRAVHTRWVTCDEPLIGQLFSHTPITQSAASSGGAVTKERVTKGHPHSARSTPFLEGKVRAVSRG